MADRVNADRLKTVDSGVIPNLYTTMNDSPLIVLLLAAGAGYIFKLWWEDATAARKGKPNPRALPGAAFTNSGAILIAAIGALVLVGVETGGELALGVSAEQSTIVSYFLLAMIAAGILEELVFRGYLVITQKGTAVLIASAVGFSLLFSLAHVQYYTESAEGSAWYEFEFLITAKSAWTLLLLFLNSLWFYYVRFMPVNPTRSLLPCFAAHIASNIGVFLVKLVQGHVTWL